MLSFVKSFLKSPVALGLVACFGAEGSWKFGLRAEGCANVEGQTNINGNAPALKELEECRGAAGRSPGLSTYFFDYSNRSSGLRHTES